MPLLFFVNIILSFEPFRSKQGSFEAVGPGWASYGVAARGCVSGRGPRAQRSGRDSPGGAYRPKPTRPGGKARRQKGGTRPGSKAGGRRGGRGPGGHTTEKGRPAGTDLLKQKSSTGYFPTMKSAIWSRLSGSFHLILCSFCQAFQASFRSCGSQSETPFFVATTFWPPAIT